MDDYLMLQILHGVLTFLLFAVAGGLLWGVLRAWHGGLGGWAPNLRQSVLFGVPALLALGVALPITGWWLLALAEIPFGLTWVLGSSILYLLAGIAWLAFTRRLLVLHAGDAPSAAPRSRFLGFSLGYGAAGFLLLLAILVLTLAKPA
ncbi:DUF2269 family protein [Pseudomonas sp. No.21]|uniref:DUF2269 family protein n=1 Tax=Pseudomonas TaxID=286 RepID=UPI001314F185|nr:MULTISPECIES: DUF2269 family protein [Pseudomonas]MDW3710815.1 DUF2269 family protein [Pseudomonas sp. 2023EL-01195]GJN47485.1 hypothetical protein TUM20249_34710 [Pseudomonas tohonis]